MICSFNGEVQTENNGKSVEKCTISELFADEKHIPFFYLAKNKACTLQELNTTFDAPSTVFHTHLQVGGSQVTGGR